MGVITYQVGGGAQKLGADLGIVEARTVHESFTGEITLVTRERLDATPLLAPFARLTIYDGSTAVAAGWNDAPRKVADAGKERWAYTLPGPMRWLERVTYTAPRWGATGLTNASVVTLGARTALSAGNPATTPITLVAQLQAAIDCAASAGAPIRATINITDVNIPWERRVDDSCADVLLSLLQWCPGATGRWSIEGENYRLTISESGPSRTCSEQLQLTAADVRPRYDELYSSVDIIYLYTLEEAESFEALAPFVPEMSIHDTATAGPDGTELGAGRTLTRTIELQRGDPIWKTLAAGYTLAQKVGAYAGRLQIDADFTCRALDWARQPGDRWEWSGALAMGPGRWSVCQAIERDLQTGRERVTVGAPRHLGIDALSALWKRRARQGDSTQPGGGDDNPGQRNNTATSVNMGRLKAKITPEAAASAGAVYFAIPRRGGALGPFQGTAENEVPPGRYTIRFIGTAGWAPPASVPGQLVTSGGTKEIDEAKCVYSESGSGVAGWRAEVRPKPVAEGAPPTTTWQVRVPPGAELRISETPNDLVDVDNVGEWADIATYPAIVFLKATFERSGTLDTAQIRGNADEAFDLDAAAWEPNSALEFDDDADERRHKITRKLIARITRDGDAAPVVENEIGTHLTLVKDMVIGRPATLLVAP